MKNTNDYPPYSLLGIKDETIKFCDSITSELGGLFEEAEKTAEYNQIKVIHAMQKNRLSDAHFTSTTGYGYNDLGRDTLESIYADIFHTESALVRPQLISGTHAISTALFANLSHGDEILLATGTPYDTLLGVIGIRETRGSLAECGITHKIAELTGGLPDYDAIRRGINEKTRIVAIQRSKGYMWRHSLNAEEIGNIIRLVKSIDKDIICFVDNCYGEFVCADEPSDYGADIIAGSLIKNPGGGLAPVGGYIAGRQQYVENAAYRLTAPGLGKEVGPSLGAAHAMLQGLFLAPSVVCAAIKGAILTAALFDALKFETLPLPNEKRGDIVQAVALKSPDALIAFCVGIQKAAAVDSFVSPIPSPMPGYDCPVIMAAGAFIQGSSIELSADAPLRPPFNVFMQGGLTWQHAKFGALSALNELFLRGLVKF